MENNCSEGYLHNADLLKFAQKIKTRFTDFIANEITSLASVFVLKTQFGLIVKFSIIRKNENTIYGTLFQT